jgi:hypothetical protein
MKTFTKDANALLDYCVDWSDWLDDSESITAVTVTVQSGITKTAHSETDGVVKVWLSGGTVGDTYTVAVKIQTDAGRIDERTFKISVTQK